MKSTFKQIINANIDKIGVILFQNDIILSKVHSYRIRYYHQVITSLRNIQPDINNLT